MADIRLAQLADMPAIAPLRQSTEETHWPASMMQECIEHGQCWLAVEQGMVAAFAVFSQVLDEAELLNIAVAPAWRRHGLARLLITTVLGRLQGACVIRRCFLEVAADNAAALALYRRLGFQSLSIRKNYYPSGSGNRDAIVMCLEL